MEASMDSRRKANPAHYPKMRANALRMQVPGTTEGSVHMVFMDWSVGQGMATIMAAADGTASLYLSSGGGFIGGGQRYPAIRAAALAAVGVAQAHLELFASTEATDLPKAGEVCFYATTSDGIRRAVASEARLVDGTDPLLALGVAMQRVVTEYRMHFSPQTTSKTVQ
jgi:hypothetical protein